MEKITTNILDDGPQCAWRPTDPKSVCQCGHTGDGPNGEHANFEIDGVECLYEGGGLGHGECLFCDCVQFTWVAFTPAFARTLPH